MSTVLKIKFWKYPQKTFIHEWCRYISSVVTCRCASVWIYNSVPTQHRGESSWHTDIWCRLEYSNRFLCAEFPHSKSCVRFSSDYVRASWNKCTHGQWVPQWDMGWSYLTWNLISFPISMDISFVKSSRSPFVQMFVLIN